MELGGMKIELKEIPIREVVAGYIDSAEEGVTGYGGRLNIRPKFQREFIYDAKERNAVIRTVKNNFPLGTMYWVKNPDGNFEMLDGQQRTVSICQYVNGDFTLDDRRTFDNLEDKIKAAFLNYKLMIYICEGDDAEKLEWFKTINIANKTLTAQEMRNAIFACEWLTDAKKYFSKTNCPAQNLYGRYLKGAANRQEYLETALKWISAQQKLEDIRDYMNLQKSQKTKNCNELWFYFEDVFKWVERNFKYRNEMKGVDWGILYNKYGGKNYDAQYFENEIVRLMEDEDVTNNKGIYEYLFDGQEKHLSIRKFTPKMKRAAYERQQGICNGCKKHFEFDEMHADHIKAWSKGGTTTAENCQVLCANCNREKGGT